MGFTCQGTKPSPLRGAKEGNVEFLAAFELVDPHAPLPVPGSAGPEEEEEETDEEAAPDAR